MKRPGSPILFAICVLIIIVSFGAEDRASCERSHAVRAADHAYFSGVAQRALDRSHLETGMQRTLDLQTYKAALAVTQANHPLNCAFNPLPDRQ